MKLNEIRNIKLHEEPVPSKNASEFWEEHKDDAKLYKSVTTYYVKNTKNGYEVHTITPNEQKMLVKTMSKDQLMNVFSQSPPNQKPDAEGYVTYRSNKKISALKNTDDPVKIIDGDSAFILKSGDYLIQDVQGEQLKYHTMKDAEFDAEFKPI